MIDSLGSLMLHHSAGNIRQFLQRLYSQCEAKQSRVVGIVHTDSMLPQGFKGNIFYLIFY